MYGWIWQKLPFGVWGKAIGSLLLTVAAVALLWYVVFPAVEPHLPNNDGQVTDSTGVPAGGDSDVVEPSPS